MSERSYFLPVPEEIVYYFLICFGIVQIWPMHHSLNKKVWLSIMFLPLKENPTLFQIWISFAIPSLILSDLELSRIELPKLTPSILMEVFIILFALIDQFYFYMPEPLRLDFLHSLSLSKMHVYIVLKSLVSYYGRSPTCLLLVFL